MTASGANSMTDLVLELVQTQQNLDEHMIALLQFQELLGNALLFFLHEQLRKEPRFQNTLTALQHKGLIIDVKEIKQTLHSIKEKYDQAVKADDLEQVLLLAKQRQQWQQVEPHYAQFLEFSQRFADWAQLLNVQLEQIFAALPKLQERLVKIENNTEQIIAILKQLMTGANLSPQIKPRDELTQYSSDSLKLIKKARQLFKHVLLSDLQYHRVAIGLGSVMSSLGELKQAEELFTKAYQQANNDEERALSRFNLFQVFIRQQVYDKALSNLQEAIKLNPQRLKKEPVVIKCFWEIRDDSQDALFKEAFLMAEIAGEYVPQPLDCGFVDLIKQERGYFVSEYIKGTIDGES